MWTYLHGTTNPSDSFVINFFTTIPTGIVALLIPNTETTSCPWGTKIGSSVDCPLNVIEDPPARNKFFKINQWLCQLSIIYLPQSTTWAGRLLPTKITIRNRGTNLISWKNIYSGEKFNGATSNNLFLFRDEKWISDPEAARLHLEKIIC